MVNIPFHKARLKAVSRAERAFDKRLISFRKDLIAYVFSEMSAGLIMEGNSIADTSQNLIMINRLDRIVESYVRGNRGMDFLRSLVGDIDKRSEERRVGKENRC